MLTFVGRRVLRRVSNRSRWWAVAVACVGYVVRNNRQKSRSLKIPRGKRVVITLVDRDPQ